MPKVVTGPWTSNSRRKGGDSVSCRSVHCINICQIGMISTMLHTKRDLEDHLSP